MWRAKIQTETSHLGIQRSPEPLRWKGDLLWVVVCKDCWVKTVFFRRGLIIAAFNGAGTELVWRNILIMIVINGPKADIFVFMRVEGNGLRARVVGFIFLTISKICCWEKGEKEQRGSEIWSCESDDLWTGDRTGYIVLISVQTLFKGVLHWSVVACWVFNGNHCPVRCWTVKKSCFE